MRLRKDHWFMFPACVPRWFAVRGRLLPLALTSLAHNISKIIYIILLFLLLVCALPRPENYLDYDIARDVCHFLFGSVNADTMYDTFFYIALIIVIFLSTVLYIMPLQLILTMRSNEIPIPPYMWLKDDGGAEMKGSVDVQEREASIETRL